MKLLALVKTCPDGFSYIYLIVNDVSRTLSSHANISLFLFPRDQYWDPFLFLIYVNDMSGNVSNKLLLYADDSAILVADKCVSNIEHILQNELEIVSE